MPPKLIETNLKAKCVNVWKCIDMDTVNYKSYFYDLFMHYGLCYGLLCFICTKKHADYLYLLVDYYALFDEIFHVSSIRWICSMEFFNCFPDEDICCACYYCVLLVVYLLWCAFCFHFRIAYWFVCYCFDLLSLLV